MQWLGGAADALSFLGAPIAGEATGDWAAAAGVLLVGGAIGSAFFVLASSTTRLFVKRDNAQAEVSPEQLERLLKVQALTAKSLDLALLAETHTLAHCNAIEPRNRLDEQKARIKYSLELSDSMMPGLVHRQPIAQEMIVLSENLLQAIERWKSMSVSAYMAR